jgi:uncharacterized iron-regulated membrane protein
MSNKILIARSLWLKVHLWTGLFLLLFSLPVGVTGSLNVYHREIDAWLEPKLFRATQSSPCLPLNQLLVNLQKSHPDPFVSVIFPDQVWTTILFHQRRGEKVWRTALEPGSGQILASREQGQAWMPWIYQLHQNLLLKPYWGEELVGVAGAALVLSCGSGLWLWWPTRRKAPSNLRLWHAWIGVLQSIVLIVVAASGWALVFPRAAAFLVGGQVTKAKAISEPSPAPSLHPSALAWGDPEAVLQVARSQRPGDQVRVLVFPTSKNHLWRVAMQPAGYHVSAGGMTQIWIDPASLQVVKVRTPGAWYSAEGWLCRQFPLHNGSLFGEAGRLLVFVSGWMFPLLAYTGGWLYYRKLRLRQRAAGKREILRTRSGEA